MITAIYGLPGAGKGALMTKFCYDFYCNERRDIFNKSCDLITKLNLTRDRKLSYPERVPIYSDYKISFPVAFRKNYETYFTNGYYLGVKNDNYKTLLLPPGSKVFLSEVQRYYDSRKSYNLPTFVSNLYEMHRHWELEFFLDLQRLSLLDLNIREICGRFIYVEDLIIEKNRLDDIIGLTWKCKEFSEYKDVDNFIEKKEANYQDVTFTHKGNIFNFYDSFNNKDKFIPDEGEDFSFLIHGAERSLENSRFYDFNIPKGYRTKNNGAI